MQGTPFHLIPGEHPLDKAARYLGGRAHLALALKVTPAAIGNWKARVVPIEKCLPIERLCPGLLSRRDLRDDWQDIWPELACATDTSTQHTAQAAQQVVAHG